MPDADQAREEVSEFQKQIGALREEIGRVIVGNREVIDGARLVSGRWEVWHAPCATTGGTAVVSAPTASSLVAICEQGIWGPSGYGGSPAVRAYFSANGGATFYLGGVVPTGEPSPPPSFLATILRHGRQVHLYSGTPGRTVWAQSRQTNRPSL